MPFTFLSCDDFLCNNLKNYLYTSTQVRLMYHVLDMRAIGPPTSWSILRTYSYMDYNDGNHVWCRCSFKNYKITS